MVIYAPLSCGGDGEWVLGCYGDWDFHARYARSGWSHRLKYFQFYHRPLSVLFAVHVPTRQAHAVWGDHMFIIPSLCPTSATSFSPPMQAVTVNSTLPMLPLSWNACWKGRGEGK